MTFEVKIFLAVRPHFDLSGHRPAISHQPFSRHDQADSRLSRRIAGQPLRPENVMRNPQALADSYVAVWNEPDAGRRRVAIAELWAPDGEHFVDTREARGYDALEQRITGSYEKNVRDGGHRFRAVQDARALRDVVTFHWEMLPADGEPVMASGLEILVVNDWGRIVTDYQFFLGKTTA